MYLQSIINIPTQTTFEYKLQTNAIAFLMAKLISIVLYGLAKSYINSKPLGMQTLYDNVSKLFINCCFILDFVSILNIIWANFFDPINEYVATILAFASYLFTVTAFTCLLCVQIVRFLYLTYPSVLDYFEENKTIKIFKQIVFVGALIFTFIEVSIMAIRVVQFSNGGYKIRQIFA